MKTETLTKLLEGAWSIENRPGHGAQGRQIREVGAVRKGDIEYVVYLDDEGDAWYETRYIRENTPVTASEFLFGRKKAVPEWIRANMN